MKLVLDGIEFDVSEEYYDITIGELVESAQEEKKNLALVNYLKDKYEGFIGIPYCCLEDETHMDDNQVDNIIAAELNMPKQTIKKKKDNLFLPFELVAELAIYESSKS